MISSMVPRTRAIDDYVREIINFHCHPCLLYVIYRWQKKRKNENKRTSRYLPIKLIQYTIHKSLRQCFPFAPVGAGHFSPFYSKYYVCECVQMLRYFIFVSVLLVPLKLRRCAGARRDLRKEKYNLVDHQGAYVTGRA